MPANPDLVRDLRLADPSLSRFDPLPRIICFDDFDRGFCGWTQLVGNYEDSLDTMLPGYAQHSQAMLSTLANWESGSHGAFDGDYALKIATRPRRGAQNVAIKRLTFRHRGPIRMECYATFKPEATELQLLETDVRSFGFLYDLQVGDQDKDAFRIMPHMRFLNADGGKHLQRWQFKRQTTPFTAIGSSSKTVSHYHLSPEDWQDLPGGDQRLCYNEIATKVNWHYLRFDFDLATMRGTRFQCNDRVYELDESFNSIRIPAMRNLWCMLNLAFFAETDTDKRAFLYLGFRLPFGGLLMLPLNFTAVVARNEPWSGAVTTEPYEGGWAKEAIVFVRALAFEGTARGAFGTIEASIQISPDGIRWAEEGTRFALPSEVDAVTFARVCHFGNWLRLAVELPEGLVYKAVVAIHLK